MNNSKKICAIIPAYNEEATIGEIVQQTKKYLNDVYVINNGSSDRTCTIAQQYGANIIDCSRQRGYGIAQYTGQQFAIEKGFDFILQLDADGQHDPNYIPLFIEAMSKYDCDIVLGSRFLHSKKDHHLSFTRYVGIKFFSLVVSILGGERITDVTSGYKIYNANCLKKLSKPCDRHPAIEQMLEIAKKGMRIKEIPVEMQVRAAGKSHLSLIKFVLYPFRAIWLLVKVLIIKR